MTVTEILKAADARVKAYGEAHRIVEWPLDPSEWYAFVRDVLTDRRCPEDFAPGKEVMVNHSAGPIRVFRYPV